MSEPEVVIELDGIEKAFGATSVLRGTSLRIQAGETFTILVGSGSGKSVCLKHMIGLLRPDASKSLPAGRVQIAGDVELMRRIEQLSRRFDPDWEAAFAERLGPIFGPQAARHLRDAFAWIGSSARGFTESAAEYVQEESGAVVAGHELDEFGAAVDRLRDDVDRFEARLQRLSRQREAR